MNPNKYEITLTNNTVEHTYEIYAMNEAEAIILAQSEAIKQARGYEIVKVCEIDKIGIKLFCIYYKRRI